MSIEGIKRSAVLLMALGQQEAVGIFRFLGPREVQKIGVAMAGMKTLTREQVSETLEWFTCEVERQTGLAVDSGDYLRSVLISALGEDKGGQVLERILGGNDTAGIEGLKWMDAESVGELVRKEHPQIIATLMVHLDPDQACEVVSSFPERLRSDVLLRIATLDGIQPIALRELDDVLEHLLSGGENIKRSPMGGAAAAAEIINFMQTPDEQSVLDSVREYDPELAQQIIDRMFTFDNLLDLDNTAIQLLLKEIDAEAMVVAVKDADTALRQKFLPNMSRRAAELFVEDLDSRGPVRVSEVEEKQRAVIQVVRKLAESGQIAIDRKQEDAYISWARDAGAAPNATRGPCRTGRPAPAATGRESSRNRNESAECFGSRIRPSASVRGVPNIATIGGVSPKASQYAFEAVHPQHPNGVSDERGEECE